MLYNQHNIETELLEQKKLSQKYCDQELIGISSLRQAPVIKRTPTISYQGGKPLSSPDGKSNKYFANPKQISNKCQAKSKQISHNTHI